MKVVLRTNGIVLIACGATQIVLGALRLSLLHEVLLPITMLASGAILLIMGGGYMGRR